MSRIDTNTAVWGKTLLENIREKFETSNNGSERDSITRIVYIAELVGDSAQLLPKVKKLHQDIFDSYSHKATGFVLLQDHSLLAFIETSSDDATDFLKKLQHQAMLSNIGILTCSDDNPQHIMKTISYRAVSISKKPDIDFEEDIAVIINRIVENIIKLAKRLGKYGQREIDNALDTLNKAPQDFVISDETAVILCKSGKIMELTTFVDIYGHPTKTILQCDQVWPIYPLVSY